MFPGWCSGMENGFLLKTGPPARVQESWPELSGLRPNWNKRGKDSLLFTLTALPPSPEALETTISGYVSSLFWRRERKEAL